MSISNQKLVFSNYTFIFLTFVLGVISQGKSPLVSSALFFLIPSAIFFTPSFHLMFIEHLLMCQALYYILGPGTS